MHEESPGAASIPATAPISIFAATPASVLLSSGRHACDHDAQVESSGILPLTASPSRTEPPHPLNSTRACSHHLPRLETQATLTPGGSRTILSHQSSTSLRLTSLGQADKREKPYDILCRNSLRLGSCILACFLRASVLGGWILRARLHGNTSRFDDRGMVPLLARNSRVAEALWPNGCSVFSESHLKGQVAPTGPPTTPRDLGTSGMLWRCR